MSTDAIPQNYRVVTGGGMEEASEWTNMRLQRGETVGMASPIGDPASMRKGEGV